MPILSSGSRTNIEQLNLYGMKPDNKPNQLPTENSKSPILNRVDITTKYTAPRNIQRCGRPNIDNCN